MAWNFMQIEYVPQGSTLLMRPAIGTPGCLTREQARAEIQRLLDSVAALRPVAETWRKDEQKDDVVYAGPFMWAIYEHTNSEDRKSAAHAWLDDLANRMREISAGTVKVQTSWQH